MKIFLKKIYSYWMKFVRILGLINGTIIFTILYFLVFGIYAIIFKVIKFLSKKPFSRLSYWESASEGGRSLEDMERQF